jgi:hypothetical protein
VTTQRAPRRPHKKCSGRAAVRHSHSRTQHFILTSVILLARDRMEGVSVVTKRKPVASSCHVSTFHILPVVLRPGVFLGQSHVGCVVSPSKRKCSDKRDRTPRNPFMQLAVQIPRPIEQQLSRTRVLWKDLHCPPIWQRWFFGLR